MSRLFLLMGVFILSTCGALTLFQREQFMDPMEIIRYHGYPAETHETTTQDGYILVLHRIPYGRNGVGNGSPVRRPPVLLQHGLLGSSFDYLSLLPEKSLSYSLADAGYDVWIGNNRGNIYSTEHATYAWRDSRYWNFSWDEMSEFDYPAMIDYVLATTNKTELYLVGHSQGVLTYFASSTFNQSIQDKVKYLFGLAPALSSTNFEIAFNNLLSAFPTLAKLLLWLTPNEASSLPVMFPLCGQAIYLGACKVGLGMFSGPTDQLNTTRIPIYVAHYPGGTSRKNLLHWLQQSQNGTAHYDYGGTGNLARYGTPFPRSYNYSGYRTSSSLYYSPADRIVSTEDMKIAFSLIPSSTIIRNRNLTNFAHTDFIWGDRAKTEIYDEIIGDLAAMEGA
ncbi:hypothetical protein PFISCL1PPCAC_17783 [Pristionchus fissidentatus]|uniref:Lipase n=1 Tax=Pristionchus fissidentatus TaxID=1538716 RepID=A0AAV5W3U9_9BILA|nr:hypothetical protein PFISCL1PPCAC_17783 [Pristionchus fissidentatus]